MATLFFSTLPRRLRFPATRITCPHRRCLHATTQVPDFAFAFDIDGVLLRSADPVPRAHAALDFLRRNAIPFILLTNGGGKHEADRVAELSHKLRLPLDTGLFVQSHTPFADMDHYKDKTVLVCGGDGAKCRDVAEQYGYRNVITPADIYVSNPDIWPFSHALLPHYKQFGRALPSPPKIDAIFVYADPRDWGLDLAVIVDLLLSSRGQLGTLSPLNGRADLPNAGYQQDAQPPLHFSNPDLWWAARYHLSRLGQGGFREALEGVWRKVTDGRATLQKHVYGKPYQATYEFAEKRLLRHRETLFGADAAQGTKLRTVYMVGDNPESDIRGANGYESPVGTEWRSLLVRTGVYQEGSELSVKPTRIVPDVSEAVKAALKERSWSARLEE
ncbi:cat eye syndrome critical region protein 5 precursor [Phyllosticta citriasiana]|uniref:Cat eye syndrome critical region protein 5 n=1 Tax=Phyllosticta citriasiana TaxID=595635 RepID=A0ABR1KIN9_9PEZI